MPVHYDRSSQSRHRQSFNRSSRSRHRQSFDRSINYDYIDEVIGKLINEYPETTAEYWRDYINNDEIIKNCIDYIRQYVGINSDFIYNLNELTEYKIQKLGTHNIDKSERELEIKPKSKLLRWKISNANSDCLIESLVAYAYFSVDEIDVSLEFKRRMDSLYNYLYDPKQRNSFLIKYNRIYIIINMYNESFKLGLNLEKYGSSEIRNEINLIGDKCRTYPDFISLDFLTTDLLATNMFEYNNEVLNSNNLYVEIINKGNYHYYCLIRYHNKLITIDSSNSLVKFIDNLPGDHLTVLRKTYENKNNINKILEKLSNYINIGKL